MAKDFLGLIITMLLIALFTIGLISVGVNLSNENNPNATILQDTIINETFTDLETNLGEQQNESQRLLDAFQSEDPIKTFVFLFSSIIGAVKTVASSLSTFTTVIFSMITQTIGIGQGTALLILGTFSAIFLLLFLFLGWRALKSGN